MKLFRHCDTEENGLGHTNTWRLELVNTNCFDMSDNPVLRLHNNSNVHCKLNLFDTV